MFILDVERVQTSVCTFFRVVIPDMVFDGLDSAGNGKLVPFTRRRDF
jgi:hypothetical protein